MKFKMRYLRAFAALTLALTMSIGFCAPAGASVLSWLFGGEEDEAQPAMSMAVQPEVEVAASSLTDDGMIRVYLKSLESPQQLHMTLAGSYALEGDAGFYFDRDTRVTLSEADGCVYMAVSGLTINMGSAMTLTRHAVNEGEENGLYIDETKRKTLYCGDLTVSAENGALRPVLKMHIEDYLLGVVAYEMSDSFPIEALKAQSVAARTYAMQRKWSAGKRDYDLVDTTADQVFRGYSAEYTNVIEAVRATRGVVGVYNGGFATCYYTASNGGQTALASHIWGGTGADGYLAMAEDPYDLENPSSLQNDITIDPECKGSSALKQMLMEALSAEMAKQGFSDGNWKFEKIIAVAPANPRFEGSMMYDDLAFTVNLKAMTPAVSDEPAATEVPAEGENDPFVFPGSTPEAPADIPLVETDHECTVYLDAYDQIKDGLSLGLNGADYELISVETEKGENGEAKSFKIIMRRFGHGVGMSQRGAQQMAGKHGKNWMEILNFYYPGMSVERIAWPEYELTAREELPDNVGAARPLPTPTPTPAPLPALQEGEYYAKVQLETKSSSLNVRETPSTSARIMDQLAHGRRLIVSGEPNEEGWVSVHTAEVSGYVKIEYLVKE